MKIDKKAQDIRNLYNNSKTSQRDKWRASSEIAYNYFLGNQLTAEEVAELEAKKMPTFIINKMTPQLELMMYFLTARNPRWQAVGADETDSAQAEIHGKMAQYIWTISSGQTILAQIIRDALSKSLGYAKVIIDPDEDDGMGEVKIESEEPWNVIVDPHSRDPFFRDASYMLIAKDMTIEKAAIEFPQFSKAKLINMAENDREYMLHNWDSPVPTHSFDIDDDHDSKGQINNFIKYYEFYERKRIPYVRVVLLNEGEIESFIVEKKEWDLFKKEEMKLPEGERPIIDKLHDEIDFFKKKVFRTECLAYEITDKEVSMPGDGYPLIPLPYRHTGTPYPMSVAMDLVGKQEEINKSHQIMIHHANLASVPRWLAEEGQITDVDKFESNSSTPGAVLTYNPSINGNPPTAVQPMQLNNAFYQITKDGAQDMEYISGMSHYMMGQGDRSGREPYRGLLAQDDFGTRRVRGFATNVLNEFMNILGKTVDNFAKELYTAEKVIHVANPDDPELIERFVVNPVTEEDAQEFFNEKSTKYNIMFVGGSTLLVNRWAELEQMLELYQQNIVDKTSVLMKTDIGNKKAIMQKMDEINQLQGMVQQAQEQIDELQKNNEILERQIVNTRISAKVSEANIDINAEKEAFISKLKDILQDAGNSAERKKIEIEKLIAELENEKITARTNNES
jgi:hypothetical protein